jgi:CHASE2 domain-containing sensor protein
MKKFTFLFVMVLVFLLVSACAPVQGIGQRAVELPPQLQALIGLGVLYLVGLLLRGRVPDEFVMEIAATLTTATLTVIGVLLRLIPLEFEPVANAILNLIVVLLGMLTLARGLLVAFGKRQFAQRVHLLK